MLNDKIRVEGGRRGRQEYIPAILFIKLVTHVLGEFPELTYIVGVNHETPSAGFAPLESNCQRWCLVRAGETYNRPVI
jgi:hypothetical protein